MRSELIYIDLTLHFRRREVSKTEEVLPAFFKGSIVQSLLQIFGEIGGLSTVDLIRFDEEKFNGILRVQKADYFKVRSSIILVDQFQGQPCRFDVNCVSPELSSLIRSQF